MPKVSTFLTKPSGVYGRTPVPLSYFCLSCLDLGQSLLANVRINGVRIFFCLFLFCLFFVLKPHHLSSCNVSAVGGLVMNT